MRYEEMRWAEITRLEFGSIESQIQFSRLSSSSRPLALIRMEIRESLCSWAPVLWLTKSKSVTRVTRAARITNELSAPEQAAGGSKKARAPEAAAATESSRWVSL